MRAGDILLFMGGKRLVDEVISLQTHSEFTHAALAINEFEFVEAWWHGVRKNNLEGYRSIIDGYRRITVFTPITPLSEVQQAEIVGYGLGKIGEPFDFYLLVGFIIERIAHLKYNPFGSKHKTICSQLVFQAYKQLFNIDLLPRIDDYSVTPSDLETSKLLQQVESYQ